jgi:hypothetical protein
MLSTMRKALMGAALPIIYAVANQVLAGGAGPTEAEVTNLSVTAGSAVEMLVQMLVGGVLVWAIPNKPTA